MKKLKKLIVTLFLSVMLCANVLTPLTKTIELPSNIRLIQEPGSTDGDNF